MKGGVLGDIREGFLEEEMAEPGPEDWKKVNQVKKSVSVVLAVLTRASDASFPSSHSFIQHTFP